MRQPLRKIINPGGSDVAVAGLRFTRASWPPQPSRLLIRATRSGLHITTEAGAAGDPDDVFAPVLQMERQI